MIFFIIVIQHTSKQKTTNHHSWTIHEGGGRVKRDIASMKKKQKEREALLKCGQIGDSDTAICRNNQFRTSKLVGYNSNNSHAACSVTLRLPALRVAACWVRSTIDVSLNYRQSKKGERGLTISAVLFAAHRGLASASQKCFPPAESGWAI